MQSLILAKWVKGEAADRGITVDQDDIDAELKRIKEQSFSSEKEFEKFVEQSKFSPADVQEQVELTLLRDKLEQAVVTKPTVSDDEIEKFYEVNIDSFKQPASRDVRVILNSSQAKAEQAKQALEADDSDASWKKVAKQYSQDQASKDRGGLLEGLTEGQGDPQLEEQAFSAAEGEIVGPFKTDRGWYVIEVTRDQPGDDAAARRRRAPRSSSSSSPPSSSRSPPTSRPTSSTSGRRGPICAPEETIELCSNFVAARGRAGPGPADAAGRDLPTQPIEPGHVDDLDRRLRAAGPAAGPAAAADAAPRRRPPAGAVPLGPNGAPDRRRAADRRAADHAAPPPTPSRRHRAGRPRRPDPPMSSDDARAAAGADAIAELDAITRRLRRECPWDRAQDERSIVPHTVEEAYELADAAAAGRRREAPRRARRRPLPGPLPRAAARGARAPATCAAVAANTTAKLIRRHPHVFGEVEVAGTDEVRSQLGPDQARAGGARRRGAVRRRAREPARPPLRPQAPAPRRLRRPAGPGRRRATRRSSGSRPPSRSSRDRARAAADPEQREPGRARRRRGGGRTAAAGRGGRGADRPRRSGAEPAAGGGRAAGRRRGDLRRRSPTAARRTGRGIEAMRDRLPSQEICGLLGERA